jgi:hypothetical protein
MAASRKHHPGLENAFAKQGVENAFAKHGKLLRLSAIRFASSDYKFRSRYTVTEMNKFS